MSDLYDSDIVAWSEQQAGVLRRRAANEIDWDNVAEEIESVGNEQRNAVESLLTNIMRHRLQIAAWPEAQAAAHWQHEVDVFVVQTRRQLRRSPGLRPLIEAELTELFRDAVSSMYREVEGRPPPPLPAECPWTLDELLGKEPDGPGGS